MIPVIFGLSGPALTSDEQRLFSAVQPLGYILFGRNIVDPVQVRALTDDLRAVAGRDTVPILIDQEGGRVARLRPPHWPEFPAAGQFDQLYDIAPATAMAAARSDGFALALMLTALGVNVDCLPVLDVRHPGAHDIVGDRSFGSDPVRVAALGRAMLDGLSQGGVAGVMKHIPGHGRALADSHLSLPQVDATTEDLADDIAPFAALAGQARMAMVAHILYAAWDAERPASSSPYVIDAIIRRQIGFDGLLMTDDIEMGALDGPAEQRAVAALEAGCDVVLHCSGDLAGMKAVAATMKPATEVCLQRLERSGLTVPQAIDAGRLEVALGHRDQLLALAT